MPAPDRALDAKDGAIAEEVDERPRLVAVWAVRRAHATEATEHPLQCARCWGVQSFAVKPTTASASPGGLAPLREGFAECHRPAGCTRDPLTGRVEDGTGAPRSGRTRGSSSLQVEDRGRARNLSETARRSVLISAAPDGVRTRRHEGGPPRRRRSSRPPTRAERECRLTRSFSEARLAPQAVGR
jgi:hypothetical protein